MTNLDLRVRRFAMILLLPMRVKDAKRLKSLIGESGGRWSRAPRETLLDSQNPQEWVDAYNDSVYFYPAVNEILEREGEVYETRCYTHLEVENPGAPVPEKFEVRSIQLVFLEGGVLFLRVELIAIGDCTFRQIRNAMGLLRMAFPPAYYIDRTDEVQPSGVVRKAVFTPATAEPEFSSDALRNAIGGKPTLLPHWRQILGDATMHVDLLGDARMPLSCYIGMERPEQLIDDDWFAIAEADEATFPTYAPKFRQSELPKRVYDRWWDPDPFFGGNRDQRIVVGRSIFALVQQLTTQGRWKSYQRWRRQHGAIVLLAHYQYAALKVLERRISELGEKRNPMLKESGRGRPGVATSDYQLAEMAEDVQWAMVHFSSRFWFENITPQVQTQELYRLVKESIGLDTLYREVMDDKVLLSQWIMSWLERRRQDRLESYAHIGAVLAIVGLFLSFLGSNVALEPLRKALTSVVICLGRMIESAVSGGRIEVCPLNADLISELAGEGLLLAVIGIPFGVALFIVHRWFSRKRG